MTKIGIMLDIETLSTDNRSYVYEVGAIKFDQKTLDIFDKRLWLLNGEGQENRHISPDTLEWMARTPGRWEAFAKSRSGGLSVSVWYEKFLDFLYTPSTGTQIWTKGNFDVPILGSLMRDEKRHVPWSYNHIRDFRTLLKVANGLGVETDSSKPTHDALEDCELQFDNFVKIMGALSGWNGGLK